MASAGPYANLHLDPDTTMPAFHHSDFYRPDALQKKITKIEVIMELKFNQPTDQKTKGVSEGAEWDRPRVFLK